MGEQAGASDRQANGRADADGLLKLYVSCRALLARAVGRIVRRHEIDDILQETFIRSLEASGRMRIRHPKAFMLRTATNLALNHVALAEQRLTESMEDSGDSAVYPQSGTPAELAEVGERFRSFCRAVKELPAQCRHVFILKKVYGLSQREIAQRLGISESTVEKHIAKGLLLCRQQMVSAGHAAPRGAATAASRTGNGGQTG